MRRGTGSCNPGFIENRSRAYAVNRTPETMEVPGERYAASVGVGWVADNDAHLSDEGPRSGVLRAFRARRVYLWLSRAQAELAEQVSPVIVENNSRLAGTAASCVEQTQRVDGNVRSSAVCGWSVSRDCRTRPVVSDQTSTVGDKPVAAGPGRPGSAGSVARRLHFRHCSRRPEWRKPSNVTCGSPNHTL